MLLLLLQVCERTPADKKGGHLCRRKSDGKLMLRESAMCPDADKAAFEDVKLHKWVGCAGAWGAARAGRQRPGPTRGVAQPAAAAEGCVEAAMEVHSGCPRRGGRLTIPPPQHARSHRSNCPHLGLCIVCSTTTRSLPMQRQATCSVRASPFARRFFNTNNLWLNLEALKGTLEASGGVLPLPLIKNKKVGAAWGLSHQQTRRWASREPGRCGGHFNPHARGVLLFHLSPPLVYTLTTHTHAHKHTHAHTHTHTHSHVCVQTVNPRDSKSAPVFQLETAMGSAIECFEKSGAPPSCSCMCRPAARLWVSRWRGTGSTTPGTRSSTHLWSSRPESLPQPSSQYKSKSG